MMPSIAMLSKLLKRRFGRWARASGPGGLFRSLRWKVLLVAAAAYAFALSADLLAHQRVWLINPLAVSASVSIGNDVYSLGPGARTAVSVGPGIHAVRTTDASGVASSDSIHVPLGLWERLDAPPHCVVSVHGSALLRFTKVAYQGRPKFDVLHQQLLRWRDDTRWLGGRVVICPPWVHYAFESAPTEIDCEAESNMLTELSWTPVRPEEALRRVAAEPRRSAGVDALGLARAWRKAGAHGPAFLTASADALISLDQLREGAGVVWGWILTDGAPSK